MSHRIYRRQRQQFILAAIVGTVTLVNLLFFLILFQPARSEYHNLQDSFQPLRTQTMMNQVNVARLEKLSSQLETTDQDRRVLFTQHFIPRDTGFADILADLYGMEERAGVRRTRTDYSSMEPIPQFGLYSVKIKLPVEGTYPSVVNLLKELEASDRFYIIDAIDVHSGVSATTQPASSGMLSLSMTLETFLYQ